MSTVALITVFLGVLTTKIIAFYGGVESIGVFSLYQKTSTIIVSVLSMGMMTVIVQRISVSETIESVAKILHSIKYLLVLQVSAGIIIALYFSEYITLFLFNSELYSQYSTSVKIVIIMATIILISKSMISILSGRIEIRKIAIINITVSSLTLIAAYFLINHNEIGLSLIYGSGSIVGMIIGYYLIKKVYADEIDIKIERTNIAKTLRSAPISKWLFLYPLVTSSVLLSIQVIIGKFYGIESLGLYAAVTMVETAFLAIVMAAMNTYFLPSLGNIKKTNDKIDFANKVLFMLIVITILFVLFVALFAKYILYILFSEQFQGAYLILSIQCLSLIIGVHHWVFANYLFHNDQYKTYFFLDCVWSVLIIPSIYWISINNYPLVYIAWTYFVMTLISYLLYQTTIVMNYGKRMIDKRNVLTSFGSLLVIIYIIL
jgi:O-antigen/teichoic acid export membrane protein